MSTIDPLDPVSPEAATARCVWALDNPDLVVMLHALRVELIVNYVMRHVVPPDDAEPFLYWLRFEWGKNGNPHTHGQCYVHDNPYFEGVLENETVRNNLRALGRSDVELSQFKTWTEVETRMSDFFNAYVTEMHPCKDDRGHAL